MSGQPMPGAMDPNQSLSSSILGVTSIFTALTVVCLGLRIMSRNLTTMGLKLDDYLAICATVSHSML